MKSKAAIFEGIGKPLVIDEIGTSKEVKEAVGVQLSATTHERWPTS